MPLKSDYNHIICIMEGETKNIRFVLKIYRFVLRLLNISFCGLYNSLKDAHKIMYMEVSPKGYYNYISIIYKVNTSK